MKKSTRKLVLRKVIIRELSGHALSRVIGGETDAADPWSGHKVCGSGLIVALNGDRG
ncbi:MAG TPA: hypothetical protein VNO30_20710 [Kofleriaceae bacterium]|nr:hypothetical protein [Kofleriaceae bacterium]